MIIPEDRKEDLVQPPPYSLVAEEGLSVEASKPPATRTHRHHSSRGGNVAHAGPSQHRASLDAYNEFAFAEDSSSDAARYAARNRTHGASRPHSSHPHVGPSRPQAGPVQSSSTISPQPRHSSHQARQPGHPKSRLGPPHPQIQISKSTGNLRSKSEPIGPAVPQGNSLLLPSVPRAASTTNLQRSPVSPTRTSMSSELQSQDAKSEDSDEKASYEFPPSFSRPPKSNLSYPTFSPMYLLANRTYLSSGFPALPPPTAVQPHPFSSHDVSQSDWKRFLTDIKDCGQLSSGQKFTAAVVPMVLTIGVTGMKASNAMKGGMKRRRQVPVSELVNLWNHHFFRPRGMEILLARGVEQLTGLTKCPVPDLTHERERLEELRGETSPSLSRTPSSVATVGSDYGIAGVLPKQPDLHNNVAPLSRAERKAKERTDKAELKIKMAQEKAETKARLAEEKAEKKRLEKQWRSDHRYRLWVVSLI